MSKKIRPELNRTLQQAEHHLAMQAPHRAKQLLANHKISGKPYSKAESRALNRVTRKVLRAENKTFRDTRNAVRFAQATQTIKEAAKATAVGSLLLGALGAPLIWGISQAIATGDSFMVLAGAVLNALWLIGVAAGVELARGSP